MNKKDNMKKFLLFLSLFAAPAAWAQTGEGELTVSDNQVVRQGEAVVVTFSLHVGEKVTADNRSLIVVPRLEGTGGEAVLTPIVIRGVRARVSNETQAMEAAGIRAGEPFYAANGQRLDYRTTLAWQNWMRGSQLLLSGVNAGSGKATQVEIGRVADNLLLSGTVSTPAYAESTVKSPITSAGGQSVGDELAARFTFVEPVAEFNRASQAAGEALFNYDMPLTLGTADARQESETDRFIEMTRDGALSVRFQRGSNVVSRDLDENNRMLVDLISSIRGIEAASNVKIARVVVVGFSSPDGTLDENNRLALRRAEAIRDFLTANSGIQPEAIGVYSGAIDWDTLRESVAESTMPEKYRILDILDNTPVWDSATNRGRMGELMSLNDGASYRYIVEHFFPKLRQAGAWVKVYYENL